VDTSLTVALGLGFLLGLRHALDADHVVAVSALASQHRSVARSCLLGTCWGAGHTTALLMLLVLATIPSPAGALLYVLVFGVGSTVGMLLLSGLIGLPLVLAARRSATALVSLQLVAGAASLALGLWLVWSLASS
jgi:high-affinity nickel permease